MEVEAGEEVAALAAVKLVVVLLVMRLQVLSELHVSIKSWIFESMTLVLAFAMQIQGLIVLILSFCVLCVLE